MKPKVLAPAGEDRFVIDYCVLFGCTFGLTEQFDTTKSVILGGKSVLYIMVVRENSGTLVPAANPNYFSVPRDLTLHC
jgi:hypothetical protein